MRVEQPFYYDQIVTEEVLYGAFDMQQVMHDTCKMLFDRYRNHCDEQNIWLQPDACQFSAEHREMHMGWRLRAEWRPKDSAPVIIRFSDATIRVHPTIGEVPSPGNTRIMFHRDAGQPRNFTRQGISAEENLWVYDRDTAHAADYQHLMERDVTATLTRTRRLQEQNERQQSATIGNNGLTVHWNGTPVGGIDAATMPTRNDNWISIEPQGNASANATINGALWHVEAQETPQATYDTYRRRIADNLRADETQLNQLRSEILSEHYNRRDRW